MIWTHAHHLAGYEQQVTTTFILGFKNELFFGWHYCFVYNNVKMHSLNISIVNFCKLILDTTGCPRVLHCHP